MTRPDSFFQSLHAYAEQHSSAEDSLLRELADYTRAHHPEAHMLSGHLQGLFLQLISRLVRPHRILEIGTFTGYSALCLAAGLAPDGFLHTIELREADARLARSWFDRSPHAGRIISHTGDARQLIPTLQETWDLVFIDADKPGYCDYFNQVFPLVRPNGFILADNMFFHGQVLDENAGGKSVKGIRDFTRLLDQRTDIEHLLLPLRDGISLVRKKEMGI